MLASVMFPVMVYLDSGNLDEVLAVIVACVIIVIMHWENLKRAWDRKDVVNTRQFFQKVFQKKQDR